MPYRTINSILLAECIFTDKKVRNLYLDLCNNLFVGYWGLKQIIDPWAITDEDDYPKRAYNHQPRRGRPPKGTGKKKLNKIKKVLHK